MAKTVSFIPPYLPIVATPSNFDSQTVADGPCPDRRICFNWRDTGVCRYGENCRFQHFFDVEPSKAGTEECWLFRDTGKCSWGNTCRFNHFACGLPMLSEAGRPALNAIDPIPPGGKFVCYSFRDSGTCTFGVSCKFAHDKEPLALPQIEGELSLSESPPELAAQSMSTAHPRSAMGPISAMSPLCNMPLGSLVGMGSLALGIPQQALGGPEGNSEECYAYRDTGNCRFGMSCKFSHNGEERQVDVEAMTRRDNACYSFRDFQKCRYGAHCRFSHDVDMVLDVKKSDEVCYSFRDTGDCRFGSGCRFSHHVEPVVVASRDEEEVLNEAQEDNALNEVMDGNSDLCAKVAGLSLELSDDENPWPADDSPARENLWAADVTSAHGSPAHEADKENEPPVTNEVCA
eukprot:266100_1